MLIEKIVHKKELYALIIRSKEQFKKKGINFITNEKDFLQVGFFFKFCLGYILKNDLFFHLKNELNAELSCSCSKKYQRGYLAEFCAINCS